MMAERADDSMATYAEKLTMGICKILESSPGVADVTFEERRPAERHMIVNWEQKNSCTVPEDLKNFYLMTDGFQMTWNMKSGDSPIQVGSMVINSISSLSRLGGFSVYTLPNAPSLVDLDQDSDEEDRPHFDSRNSIFELDPCNGNGKVCLVYKVSRPGDPIHDPDIWFLDRALYWHFITHTFTAYYRLLLCHLGLPQWQYMFTSYGLSPQAKQWMNMYKPITFNATSLPEEVDSYVNKLDPNKVFKSKNKTPLTKKKLPPAPAGGQKGPPAPTKPTPHAGISARK